MAPTIDQIKHPLLWKAATSANWHDDFPAFPDWAEEAEAWLRVADRHGQLDRYLGRLAGREHECDEALAELAAAYFLEERCGFRIVEWGPAGAGNSRGEFLVHAPAGWEMFVEIKSPGWEREVFEQDGAAAAARIARGKFVDGEARWTSPWLAVRDAVTKTNPKLKAGRPTLLIVNDDLALPLPDWPLNVEIALYCPKAPGTAASAKTNPNIATSNYLAEDSCFVGKNFETLGAVGIFNARALVESNSVDYRFTLYLNPNCDPSVAIPRDAFPGVHRTAGASPVEATSD